MPKCQRCQTHSCKPNRLRYCRGRCNGAVNWEQRLIENRRERLALERTAHERKVRVPREEQIVVQVGIPCAPGLLHLAEIFSEAGNDIAGPAACLCGVMIARTALGEKHLVTGLGHSGECF